jgi:hypothetical protein
MVDMGLLEAEDTNVAKHLVVRIVSMLVRMTDRITTPDSIPPLPRPRQPRKR